jgi:hypothetical protein
MRGIEVNTIRYDGRERTEAEEVEGGNAIIYSLSGDAA